MSWTRQEVSLLLEEYKKWPNLYKLKSIHYKNRKVRKQALEAIECALKVLKPGINALEIQSKFQALKQNAVKEFKKWRNSVQSGVPPEEVYQPSLWYYDQIGFVLEDYQPREGMLYFENCSQSSPTNNFNECDFDAFEEKFLVEAVQDNQEMALKDPLQCSPVPQKKIKLKIDDTFLETVTSNSNSMTDKLPSPPTLQPTFSPPSKELRSFSAYIIDKLNKIDNEDIRDSTEEEILLIVNKALKKCRELKNTSIS